MLDKEDDEQDDEEHSIAVHPAGRRLQQHFTITYLTLDILKESFSEASIGQEQAS